MADVTIAEEPVTIQEKPVTIAEEPVTVQEEPVTIQEAEPPAEPEEATETAQPKRKPGRPVGSKSKEPGKPRKPRAKVVIQEEAVEKIELPRIIEGSMPIPEEAYDLRTAKMLRLLQMQKDHRKEQKRQMYSSWFR